jgi:hypothetical protein
MCVSIVRGAGPGEYTSTASLGKQVLSLKKTTPAVSFGAR